MPWLAKLCFKADRLHEDFIVMVPYRTTFKISFQDDRFHVVGQNFLWNAHILECVNHSDEQVFLLCIRKELYVFHSTVMTDHGKACRLIFKSRIIADFCKSPVHLESLAWSCEVSQASASLCCNQLPCSRHKKFVCHYVSLYTTQASLVANFLKFVIDVYGIRYALS